MRKKRILNKGLIIRLLTESILIIISVLTALFIDDYKEERNDRQLVKAYLNGIRNDLAADTVAYIWRKGDLKETSLYCDSMIYIKEAGISITPTLLNQFEHLFSIIVGINFKNDPTFESMKSSGYLKLIENDSLQRKLSEYYSHGSFVNYAANLELARISEARRQIRNKSSLFLNFNITAKNANDLLKNSELYNTTFDSMQILKFVIEILEYKLQTSRALIIKIDEYLEDQP